MAGSDDTASDDEESAASPPDELVEPDGDGASDERWRAVALAVGNAAHAALEWSAREGWAEPGEALLASLLAREGLGGDAEALERVRRGVSDWLGSSLRRELDGWRLRPEIPFVLPLGGTVIRGQIDLLAEGPGGQRCVIDFKTDALRGRAPSQLAERYAAQREVYALAAAGAPGTDAPVRAVHLFLERADEPVVEEFGRAELAAARERLEALIGRIRGGDFVPTDEPTSAICFGCPAAARLCPHPAWRPPASPSVPSEEPEPRAVATTQGTLFE